MNETELQNLTFLKRARHTVLCYSHGSQPPFAWCLNRLTPDGGGCTHKRFPPQQNSSPKLLDACTQPGVTSSGCSPTGTVSLNTQHDRLEMDQSHTAALLSKLKPKHSCPQLQSCLFRLVPNASLFSDVFLHISSYTARPTTCPIKITGILTIWIPNSIDRIKTSIIF